MAGENILIVDDEESIRGLLERLCLRARYSVTSAESVRSAVAALEGRSFDVLIVDLSLPDGSGIEVLRRAKEVRSESEVIILTGHGTLETAVEALRLGAYDYLQKPVFDLQLILNTVSRALERQRLTSHNARLLLELRAANAEIELRRRQQLQNINFIGQALAGALRAEEVVQLLIRALLGLPESDGAGVLLLHQDSHWAPWVLVGSRHTLSIQARESLVSAIVRHLSERCRSFLSISRSLAEGYTLPDADDPQANEGRMEVSALAGLEPEKTDDAPWRCFEFGLLAIRDDLRGIVALASHRDIPFSEEALEIFRILVTQGSVALDNAYLFERTRELATRDSLTGVYNRRHFFEMLDAEISRSERHDLRLAVIMMDLDKGEDVGLKVINDTYGHQAGDEMLRCVVRFLQSKLRRADVVARYGGDEFIIMAPQTGRAEVVALAGRICEQLAATTLVVAGHNVHVTASMGAAVFRAGSGQGADLLVALADQGLYLAKANGGNQVRMVGQEIGTVD